MYTLRVERTFRYNSPHAAHTYMFFGSRTLYIGSLIIILMDDDNLLSMLANAYELLH